MRRCLLHFQSSLSGATVAVFCDNVTAVAYLRKEGGTRSPALNTIAQEILRWAESLQIRLAPQFIPGSAMFSRTLSPVLISSPAPSGLSTMDVFRSLTCQWPVMIDLFATSDNHHCSIYFSPFRDPLSAGTDALLQSWDGLLAYAFPPWSILPHVLAKLRVSNQTLLTLVAPYWPQRPWFVDLLQWLFLLDPTSSSSHGLVSATRVSTGWPFMPGDYPAIHQRGWFLFGSSRAGFLGAPSIVALQLPAEVVSLPVLVLLSGPLHLAAAPLQGGGFPLVAPLCSRP